MRLADLPCEEPSRNDAAFGRLTEHLAAQLLAGGDRWFMVTARQAKSLGPLPGPGRERLVERDGAFCFLGRTEHRGASVWAIRPTHWRP